MAHSTSRRQYAICSWIGMQLMCFALFLHPMDPRDFFILAITNPLETINSQYGAEMAIGFWVGLFLLLFGLFNWIGITQLLKALRETKPPPPEFCSKR